MYSASTKHSINTKSLLTFAIKKSTHSAKIGSENERTVLEYEINKPIDCYFVGKFGLFWSTLVDKFRILEHLTKALGQYVMRPYQRTRMEF